MVFFKFESGDFIYKSSGVLRGEVLVFGKYRFMKDHLNQGNVTVRASPFQ